jgi:hypothetical protein
VKTKRAKITIGFEEMGNQGFKNDPEEFPRTKPEDIPPALTRREAETRLHMWRAHISEDGLSKCETVIAELNRSIQASPRLKEYVVSSDFAVRDFALACVKEKAALGGYDYISTYSAYLHKFTDKVPKPEKCECGCA